MTRIALFCLAVSLSAPSFAQGAPEHPEPGQALIVHGEITALDLETRSFTLDTPEGPERFTLIEGGQVLGAGAETGFASLAVGQQVAVEVIQDETDRHLARSVQIVNSEASAGSALARVWRAPR